MKQKSRQEELERLARFRRCSHCSYDVATGEGKRACHYGDCAYLPEELDPRCPTCLYNFWTDDLEPECSDPPSCEFARFEAPRRLEALSYWLQHSVART